MHPEKVVRLGQTLAGVRMRDEGGASVAEAFVIVGVIEMPVRIDREQDGDGSHCIEPLLQSGEGALHECVDDHLAIQAV